MKRTARKLWLVVLSVLALAISVLGIAPAQAAVQAVGSQSPAAAPAAGLTATLVVTSSADSGDGTLRAAIAAASSGDTITFNPSLTGQTIVLTTTEIAINTSNLTIDGSGAPGVKVDGNSAHRVFNVSAPLTIQSLIIQNGTITGDGGGLWTGNPVTLTSVSFLTNTASGAGGGLIANSTAVLSNVNFISNTAQSWIAGGAYVGGAATLNGGTFQRNTAAYSGGGLYVASTAALTSATFISNTSQTGNGGGLCANQSLTLTSVSFLTNTAGGAGGGVENLSSTDGTFIVNGWLQQNTSSSNGGGLSTPGPVVLSNTTFLSNTTTGNSTYGGGGLASAASVQVTGGLFQGNNCTGANCVGGALSSSGVTITHTQFLSNTAVGKGGGVYASGTAALTNATFISNVSTGNDGGGAYFNSPVIVTGGLFQQNQAKATGVGGGIYLATSATVSGTQFLSNTFVAIGTGVTCGTTASCGGGIYNSSGTLIVQNSSLSGNTAALGGGVYFNTGGTVATTTLSGNWAVRGGSLFNYQGTLTVQNSTLISNTATEGGGLVNDSGTLTVQNSTLISNTATYGGGLMNYFGRLIVQNSTLSGNQATGSSTIYDGGGAIDQYGSSSTAIITNSTITGNNAPNVTGRDGIWLEAGSLTIRNSIVSGNGTVNCTLDAGTFNGASDDLADDATCTGFTQVANVNLSPLADNGGGTWTHALLPGSPAIDAGNNAACPATDQRGVGRPQNGTCDIGAYESRGFTLAKSGGDNQSATVNTVFANPLALTVASAYGEPVNGGTVTFAGPLTGASTNPVTNTATIAGGAVSQAVTANSLQLGTSTTYTVTASASGATSVGFSLTNVGVAKLSNLTLSNGTLTPAFASNTTSYTATVANNISTITVTPYQTNSNPPSTFLVSVNGGNGSTPTSGNPSGPLPLNVGANTVVVQVTDNAGLMGTYTVTVARAACLSAITVQNASDSGAGSLRQAIADVCPNGAITFHSSLAGQTIVLTTTQIVISTNNLTIDGSGAPGVKVDGNSAHRVFNVSAPLTIQSLIIQNGNVAGDGAGLWTGQPLTLTSVSFLTNTATGNGGGLLTNGAAILSNVSFISNTAQTLYGGGAYFNSPATVNGGTFQRNAASATMNGRGGGLYAFSTLNLTGTQFLTNTAGEDGGGLLANGTATLTNATFISNTAQTWYAGGAYIGGAATVNGGTFQLNTAPNVTNGRGGGLLAAGMLNLTGTQFLTNTAGADGGGLLAFYTATLTNATFISNTAQAGYGGGAYFIRAATVNGGTFQRNTAPNATNGRGGGLYAFNTLNLTGTQFLTNTAGVVGGGARLNNSGTITATTLSGNRAGGGGGIASNGPVAIANTTFANNIADDGTGLGTGGGFQIGSGNASLTNVTFSGNQANGASDYGGGAIMVYGGAITLTNASLSGNSTASNTGGGGISVYPTGTITVSLLNTLVAGNTSAANKPDLSGAYTSSDHNLIGSVDGSTGIVNGVNGNLAGTNAAPVNARLGALANYGGSTQVFPLLPGSPAINAGNNTACPTTDQRGVTRPQNGTCDIGAYESRGFALTKMHGDNQSAVISTTFAQPLVISVTSAFNEPVNGGAVTIAGPLSGASTNPITNTATIANGAASQSVTANGTAGGPYAVAASASGAPSSVNFSLTNVAIASPIANAGLDQSVFTGQMVTLNGGASSDPGNFLPLMFYWQQTGGPAVTLTGASSVTATFTAPLSNQTQVLTFTLTVTNSQQLASQPNVIVVTVQPYRILLPLVMR